MDQEVKNKLDRFFSKGRKIIFKKGETLIRADQDGIVNIHYLIKGLVRQFCYTQRGEEMTINIYKPNSFFPLVMVLGNLKNHYVFQALKEGETLQMPKEKVVAFVKDNPDVAYDLLTRISRGLGGFTSIMESLMSYSATNRILVVLFTYARRFGKMKNGKITIDLNLTHKEIASQVGLTRETVSRELEKLNKEGFVDHEHKTFILKNISDIEKRLAD